MLIVDLFKTVDLEEVQKELVLSHKKWENLSTQVEELFKVLLSVPETAPSDIHFKLNRENFDSLYVNDELEGNKTIVEFLNKCNSYSLFMNATIEEQDVEELSKSLLVAGAISYISFDGLVFTEADYQTTLSELGKEESIEFED